MPYTTITWISTGYSGSPGYTKLKFIDQLTGTALTAAATASKTLLQSVALYYPSIVTYACQNVAQTYTDAGVLTGEESIPSPPTNISGAGSGSYVGGAGAVVYWNTGVINGGHKVRGRTYFVPLAASSFQSDGTLAAAVVTALTNGANAFVAGTPKPCVNSLSLGNPNRGNQTIAITSASVKDRSAFLRTRRT